MVLKYFFLNKPLCLSVSPSTIPNQDLYKSPRFMQQCLTSIPCKSNAKEVSIHKVLITDFNVRFRVAIACCHRHISSRHFSSAKRSKNQKYVCVRILGLLLFKTKRKTFPGFSLTLHFTILFSFLSGYRYSLIFFHSI